MKLVAKYASVVVVLYKKSSIVNQTSKSMNDKLSSSRSKLSGLFPSPVIMDPCSYWEEAFYKIMVTNINYSMFNLLITKCLAQVLLVGSM